MIATFLLRVIVQNLLIGIKGFMVALNYQKCYSYIDMTI